MNRQAHMKPLSERYCVILRTASVTSHSSVLMCSSGFSGASYGAEIPVKSAPQNVRQQRRDATPHCKRTFDLTGTRLLVETLGVAGLDDGERRVDEDLDEGDAGLFVQLARDGAVVTVWRDEGRAADAGCVCEEFRYLRIVISTLQLREDSVDRTA